MAFSGHIPVLLEETLSALSVREGGRYVDGTLGRAGHTRALLERGAAVLGIDRDDEAIASVCAAAKREPEVFSALTVRHGEHGSLAAIVAECGWSGGVDGVLLDLGVSSPQLDEAERGFSFLREGPLDMRMDRTQGSTAADLVNTLPAEELADILRRGGEDRAAGRIARAIAAERRQGKIFRTTIELAECVERALPRHGAHHPATRAFQALRMAVNRELEELESALDQALAVLRCGGRLAVITFESLTDRVVKQFMARHAGRMVALQEGGERWEGELPRVRPVERRPVTASAQEIAVNPRARSAKLRVAEKTGE